MNSGKDNIKRFPKNVFSPKIVTLNDSKYHLYRAYFEGIVDLYNYLKSEPDINRNVFDELASETGSKSFAGIPYDDAVEDLITPEKEKYEHFLKLQKQLEFGKLKEIHKYKLVNTVAGGKLNIPAYIAGKPQCYETYEKVYEPKFITIDVALSYYCGTSSEQVLNRAIIITSLIKTLEKNGYKIKLNTFEISEENDEIGCIVIKLKNNNTLLNMQSLYKALCHVEFLRRILFRISETLPFSDEGWSDGYGRTSSEKKVRELLNLNKRDIFIDQPREMGIEGEDLIDDFNATINHLNLDKIVDKNQIKNEFKNKVKKL